MPHQPTNVRWVHAMADDRRRRPPLGALGAHERPGLGGTFFVDGFLAGAWKLTRGILAVRPMIPLSGVQRDEVHAEAEAMLGFLDVGGGGRVEIAA